MQGYNIVDHVVRNNYSPVFMAIYTLLTGIELLTSGVHVEVLDAPDSLTTLIPIEAATTSCVVDEHRGHGGSHP